MFKGPATFRNARFASVVDMAVGTYQDVLDLRGTTFTAGAALLNATVTKDVLAQGAVFSTLDARGLKVRQGDLDLSQAKAEQVRLDGATLDAGNVLLTSAAVADPCPWNGSSWAPPARSSGAGKAPEGCFVLDGLVSANSRWISTSCPGSTATCPSGLRSSRSRPTERKGGNSDEGQRRRVPAAAHGRPAQAGLEWFFDTVFYRGAAATWCDLSTRSWPCLLVILIGWIARLIYRDNSTHHLGSELTGARRATVRFGARVGRSGWTPSRGADRGLPAQAQHHDQGR